MPSKILMATKWTAGTMRILSCECLWNIHMLYLMALSDAVGGAHNQVLENIAKFASPSSEFQSVPLARLNPHREDYLRQAEELVHFAQLNDSSIRLTSKPTVVAVKSTYVGRLRNSKERQRRKPGSCFKSLQTILQARSQEGFYAGSCRQCRRHMAMNFGQWIESSPIDDTITTLQYNGMLWRVPASKKRDWKCNSTDFVVRVDGDLRRIKLRDVYYSADLPWNILTYGRIEEKYMTS
ncbi:unnamed protein product [Albugo candida]|uniref:Uncharacterized protein n=1 Tax=Albugo candida TaxID=65357 RepID=A0A024GJB9_9STRA|nr:unnamed protein product [Albugo candida]|eukprot:CCI46394.1 unnamed protein product [Albugo candida]